MHCWGRTARITGHGNIVNRGSRCEKLDAIGSERARFWPEHNVPAQGFEFEWKPATVDRHADGADPLAATGSNFTVDPYATAGRPGGQLSSETTRVRDLDAATMGVTIIVESIVRARQVVASGVGRRFPIGTVSGRGRSFLVPPGLARGMWIEFLEPEA